MQCRIWFYVFGGLKKKHLTDAVGNTYIYQVDLYLKFPLQKVFFEIFYCQAMTLDLSQTGNSKQSLT